MSSPPAPIPEVQRLLGLGAPKVLLVEGPTDLTVYAWWLAKLASPVPNIARLELVSAGAKTAVLASLQWFADHGGEPRVFGLVDRDEWDATTIAAMCAHLPQLRINSERHALESYFADPQEIQSTLLAINPAWAAQVGPFQFTATTALSDYIGHWALLTVTDRLKNRMSDLGYPGHFSMAVPIPPDPDILARFTQWSYTLNANTTFQEFGNLRQSALAELPKQQFRSRVWAKLFFEQVIQPALNGPPTTLAKTAADWLIILAKNAPTVPTDIAGILQPLL